MSGRLPVHIDPLRLADEGRQLQGELAGSSLARLREVANPGSQPETVAVDLRFERSAQGARRMRGAISSTVELICQRCLEPVRIRLVAEPDVLLVASEAGSGGMTEAGDTLVAEAQMALTQLVEDELLLALPMVPMHAEGECQAPGAVATTPAIPWGRPAVLKGRRE